MSLFYVLDIYDALHGFIKLEFCEYSLWKATLLGYCLYSCKFGANTGKCISKKEAIDTSTPQGKFMLTVFGAQSELERAYILQRQREGIEIAKREGKYLGRKPIELDEALLKRRYPIWKEGKITARAFMRELGLKPATFYRRINDYEKKLGIIVNDNI